MGIYALITVWKKKEIRKSVQGLIAEAFLPW